MRSLRRISSFTWLPVALAAVTPAMATAQDEAPEETIAEAARSLPDPVVVVANHNWLDVHVYARRSTGARVSLGVVTSHTTREFELPAMLRDGGGEVYLIADPIGSRGRYVTQPIVADPGTDVVFRIENALNLSSASLWAAGRAHP